MPGQAKLGTTKHARARVVLRLAGGTHSGRARNLLTCENDHANAQTGGEAGKGVFLAMENQMERTAAGAALQMVREALLCARDEFEKARCCSDQGSASAARLLRASSENYA